ncbi:MAG TPA: response regulator [Thermodesulfovibrionia bacterium]|nr:response regulator [Thermodesulfovibrionia bacterium]
MPIKILIIDDEPDMVKLLSMILRSRKDYSLITTINPLEGVELLKQDQFDLVITDLKMPGLDGEEVLESVKKLNADLPVIVITAFSTVDSALKLIKKGASDYITKPFRKEQILTAVDKTVEMSRLQTENKRLKEQLREKA